MDDELRDDARALLEAARTAHDPSPARRAQADGVVRAALASYGVNVPPLGAPSPPPWDAALEGAKHAARPAASGAAGAAKLGAGVLVLCAGAWLGVGAYQRTSTPAADPPSPVAAVATPPAIPVGPAVAVVAAPAAEPAPAPIVAAVPSRHAPVEPVRSRLRATRQRERDSHAHVDAELRLIAQADAELRAEHFDAALSTLALHARSFPKGALRDERAALRVLSLCGKQPGPQALRERERFLRTAPQSVLTARVNAACADPGAHSP